MYETQLVGEQIAGEAAKVRKQLEKIINDVNRSSFDISDLLHKIKKNGFYDGYTTFQEYTATLDIKPRKCQYLRRIAEVLETVGIARETYEPVGIAKLREITSLDPTATWTNPETNEQTPMAEFIVGLVEKAPTLALDSNDEPKGIKQLVRVLKGFVGENDFCFFQASVRRSAMDNTIRPALESMKAEIGSVGKDDEGISQDASDGTALEMLCAERMANPANHILPESEG